LRTWWRGFGGDGWDEGAVIEYSFVYPFILAKALP
jgi:hypothetical protein